MKFLYVVFEASNHWFAINYTYHKNKLIIKQSTYDPCFFYSFCLLDIEEMQINNTLILVDNNFASTKEDAIKSTKIIFKNREHLILTYPLKFNDTQIKLNLNRMILTKKIHIKEIFLIIDHVTDFTSFKEITKKNY